MPARQSIDCASINPDSPSGVPGDERLDIDDLGGRGARRGEHGCGGYDENEIEASHRHSVARLDGEIV